MALCCISGLAYTVMLMGHGFIEINERPFLWIRCVDLIISMPTMFFVLCKLAGCPEAETVLLCILTLLMSLFSTCAGLFHSWLMFSLQLITFVPIVQALCGELGKKARRAPQSVKIVLSKLNKITLIVWFSYPIVWIFGGGLHIIRKDVEVVAQVVLDVIAKCVFSYILCRYPTAINKVSDRDHL